MPSDTPAPRPPILSGDHHLVSVMLAGILAVVGGLALLAYETSVVSLLVAVAIMLGAVGFLTVAIFRLLAHEEPADAAA